MTTATPPDETRTDVPPADDIYTFVDSAVDGVDKRNNIKDLRTWAPRRSATDSYTTWMRFTKDFANYTAKNLRTKGKPDPKGSPSVAGYDGDGLALFVPVDIDVPGDRAEALHLAQSVLHFLEALGVDLCAVRCYFSGNKGFSFEIPAPLFDGFAPGPCHEVAARIKSIAFHIANEAGVTIDPVIYDPTRLWRVPNSRHGASKLYKIPLTAAEVLHQSISEIEAWARQPRDIAVTDDDEWPAAAELVELKERPAPTGDIPVRAPIDMGKLLSEGVPEGARADTLFRAASKARGADVPYEWALKLALETAAKCDPPFPDAEATKAVNSAYARYEPDPEIIWDDEPDPADDTDTGAETNEAAAPATDEETDNGADEKTDEEPPAATAPARRNIRVDNRPFEDLIEGAVRAIPFGNTPPTTFVRAGTLARVCRDEHDRPVIAPHTADSLRLQLAVAVGWKRKAGSGFVDTSPPTDVARTVLALGEWRDIPGLDSITQSPIMHADGSVHHTPGYDHISRMWYAPTGAMMPALPETPTTADVVDAVLLINDLICDFPFLGPADRATFWAALMTAMLRPLIDGPTPLFIFDKPRAGTGASLLAELVALLATGEDARMKPLGQDRGGEETRKLITSALIAGDPLIIFDNVDAAIASGHLAAALTARTWEDRILGKSELVRLPVRVSWFATGNNIRVRGDIARRSLVCRLDARVDRPWERTGFHHPRLLAYVTEHRGELLAALLTIARGWIQAGRPPGDSPTLGSFEAWSHAIGGVLSFAGVPGLLTNMAEFYEAADDDYTEWAAFLHALYTWGGWGNGERFTVAQLARQLDPAAAAVEGSDLEKLRDALPGPLATHLGKPTLRNQLGQALKAKAEARYDGYRLVKAGIQHKVVNWRVERETPPDTGGGGGPGGADPNPAHEGVQEEERAYVYTNDAGVTSPPPAPLPPPDICPDCAKPLIGARCFSCRYVRCACGQRTRSSSHVKCDVCLGVEATQ